MSMFSPNMLVGKSILLENGHAGKISKVFDIAEGLDGLSPSWIIEITLNLKERECHFEPKIGISLKGNRLFCASEIGKSMMIIF